MFYLLMGGPNAKVGADNKQKESTKWVTPSWGSRKGRSCADQMFAFDKLWSKATNEIQQSTPSPTPLQKVFHSAHRQYVGLSLHTMESHIRLFPSPWCFTVTLVPRSSTELISNRRRLRISCRETMLFAVANALLILHQTVWWWERRRRSREE